MRIEMLALREWTQVAPGYQTREVKTIDQIRHANLLLLIKRYVKIQALADALDRSHSQISQWKNRSKRKSGGVATIDTASARYIDDKLELGRGWMDMDRTESTTSPILLPGPPLPSRDYTDRHEVDESDWAMLQDISVLPKEDRDRLRAELREKAAKYRAYSEEVIARMGSKDNR